MNYMALAATAVDYGGAFSAERLALAVQMTLIGMGMIFAVLGLLWGVLALFKFVFAKPAVKPKAKSDPVVEPNHVEEIAPTSVGGDSEEELVAVITAAIAAYIASEDPDAYQEGFRVVSFRRTNGGRAWNSK